MTNYDSFHSRALPRLSASHLQQRPGAKAHNLKRNSLPRQTDDGNGMKLQLFVYGTGKSISNNVN